LFKTNEGYIIEKLLGRAPIIQVVYTSIRDFLSASWEKKKNYSACACKSEQNIGLRKIGFITATDLSDLNIFDKVAVYFLILILFG